MTPKEGGGGSNQEGVGGEVPGPAVVGKTSRAAEGKYLLSLSMSIKLFYLREMKPVDALSCTGIWVN